MNSYQKNNSNNFLEHFGVRGMRWGVRNDKDSSSKVSKGTERLVKKDAKRYADAKMFYGEGAGTRRKLLKAELDKKKRTIPGYEKLFDNAIKNVDYAKSANKAKVERTYKDTTYRARVTIKQFLGVTGSLTVAAASALYLANKDTVDNFVRDRFTKIVGATMQRP